MITILFLAISFLMIVFQRYREGRWINLISLLVTPYLLIVFFNNFYVYKLGFYKISDSVIAMLLMAFVAFFLGTLLFTQKTKPHAEENNLQVLRRYDMKRIKCFLYIVGVIGIIKAFFLYKQGILLNDMDDSEGIMGNGIVAHMLLASYSVLPIYFLNWTYNKTIKDLVPVILVIIVAFSSFVKYNVIGPIVTLFIFISFYRKSLLKKASIVMLLFVLIVFVSNYAIDFTVAGNELESSFLLGHFWKYFSGSIIYDNYIFTSGIRTDIGLPSKVLVFIFALPNMFISKLFDEGVFQHVGQELRDVSDFGEQSNVVDVIGYLYPSKGEVSDIILFLLFLFFMGVLFSYLYKKHFSKSTVFDTFIANFLTYFVFLSFFAPFYVLSNPWEIIIWALFLPPLFYKRNLKTNKYGNKPV